MVRLSVAQLEAMTPEERLEITQLSMSHCANLNKFPTIVLTCTNLVRLYLRGNELTSIPRELGNLVNLTYLCLQNNQITSIPREIGNLVKLEYFSFEDNQLTSVPRELGTLVNLKYFYFTRNKLTIIPRELGNLMCYFIRLDKNIAYSDVIEFSVVAREIVDRVVGANTFSDLGRFCADMI